jgi:hypothetical protein
MLLTYWTALYQTITIQTHRPMNRKFLWITIILAIANYYVCAQSKKDLDKDLANCKASRDSIQKDLDSLTLAYDSIRTRYLQYDTMYSVIKEKYIGFDFKPANVVRVVDSLRAKRDSTLIKSAMSNNAKTDSISEKTDIAQLVSASTNQDLIDSLQEEINHFRFVFEQYFADGTIPQSQNDLIGIWKVRLQWFELANESEKTGLYLKPAGSNNPYLISIQFVDTELAELTLNSGAKVKCFYKVNSFSKDKPYSIDFSKWKEVDNRLFISPSSTGELNVSYKKGDGYFYGFMRKR